MVAKVINIKTKEQEPLSWINEVLEKNKDSIKQTPSILLIWEGTNEKGETVAMHARLNCDTDELDWFYRSIGANLRDRYIEEYLAKHISDFIEYI